VKSEVFQMHPKSPSQIQLNLTSDLRKWRAFVAIAELGSLTHAAIFLDTSQSHLSRHLNSLERDCKARLFNRTGRGLALSDVGLRIFPIVRDLLSDAEQLEAEIHGDALEPAGQVTLDLLPSIASAIATRLFERVRERYPAIRLKVQEGSSGQVEELLAGARIDIGILYRYGDQPLEDEQALATIDSYLIGPAGDRLTSASTIPFSSLHGLPFILPGAPNGLRAALDRLSRLNRISLNAVIEADSLPLMRDGVADSGLYTVLPIHAVWAQIQENRLQAAKIVSPEIRRIVSMVLSRKKGPSRAVSAVASQITEIIGSQRDKGMWDQAGR
jgi:DNA-binding transcriptional LysR family regulator